MCINVVYKTYANIFSDKKRTTIVPYIHPPVGPVDALGVQMDITAMEMNESFREAMTVGRPVCEDPVELIDS